MKKKVIIIAIIAMMALSICACGQSRNIEYDIEGDINYIKDIFSCVNIETLAEEYSDKITDYDDLEFDGTFAGIKGTYEIELYGENSDGFPAGDIYSITFSWDYDQEVPLEEVAAFMTDYLGEPSHSDEEWGNYYWLGSYMEVTKFSNSPFGNCFDVEVFGDDCCIYFGLSTT